MTSSLTKKIKKTKSSKLFVLINCLDGKSRATTKEIAKLENVTNIAETKGSYDIITTLRSDSNEELKKTLNQLRKIKTIRGTMTLRSSSDLEILG